MKKSIGKNYIYNVIYQMFILLVPLITTPYISRVLSVEGIGIYSFTYSIATFFSLLAELGSFAYARREIAYCQDNKEKRSTIFWETFILRIITTTVCLVLYFIYIINSKYFIIGLIQMIYIIATVFDITWFFQGMEDFGKIVIRNSAVKIIGMIFIFAFVKSENDLIIYILGLAIIYLIGNIVTWSNISKYVQKIHFKNLNPLRHLKGTINLFIPNMASQVYLLLDKTMLGFLTIDNIENGYYEQAQKIIKMTWTFLTTFSAVMSPRIAYLYMKNNKDDLNNYMRKSFNIMWLLSSVLGFGIVSVANNVVPWFLGNEYSKVITLLTIFSFILFPIGIASVTGTQYLVTLKKHRIYTLSIVIGAIFNFTMNCYLIPRYYSIGAAISSVLAEILIVIIQIIYIVYYIKEIKMKDIFSYAWQYILAGLIMFMCLKVISLSMSSNIYNSILLILIGGIIYFIILVILKNKIVLEEINKIKKFLIKIKNKYYNKKYKDVE